MKKRLDPNSRPTAKRHLHKHGKGFITRKYVMTAIDPVAYDGTARRHRVYEYKHRPGYDRPLATNNQRVRAGRGIYASR